jgi:DeoR/GlpR family transcriptional regulator of sugar metabolism
MVYDLLDDQPQTVAELTHLYRKSGSTLRKHLAGLRTHGLAEREGGGWVRGQASPDDVAAALGSSGAGEHKAKRYQEERERWKEWTRRERTQRPEVVDAFQRKMLAASDTTSVEVTA